MRARLRRLTLEYIIKSKKLGGNIKMLYDEHSRQYSHIFISPLIFRPPQIDFFSWQSLLTLLYMTRRSKRPFSPLRKSLAIVEKSSSQFFFQSLRITALYGSLGLLLLIMPLVITFFIALFKATGSKNSA
jgi:hypothetical protein